ncbi:hypothetical protein CDL15_Pgr002086 [Punica granatum]|uniref:Calcineurin-like phosphoesterase domain-containing protein n=1 Tax=Punica granatum TaxID=22663 RepID=A0A218XDF0_PUNGR|nr:hypothetical protein CDL15_Pgr002086 [Punica granatum]PKI36176.1 hypothetical protein CRG98_043434 [Punica granatum]
MDGGKPQTVCCIGEIHGYISRLQSLWSNLEAWIPRSYFDSAMIIFLSDYCDRGPDTHRVIDFLISLPSRYPRQKHIFLAGNRDFALAAFIGAIPPPPDRSGFRDGWKEYEVNEEREGWYRAWDTKGCTFRGGCGQGR